ncbi:MAG: hypothetical protein E4G99_12560 [Anaerolineales bacterium]|nr:MAG: hypothetical protein E4G99_12560 [Anaerolineales bacterium]
MRPEVGCIRPKTALLTREFPGPTPTKKIVGSTVQERLQALLTQMEGEVMAIVPYVSPSFQLMGATSKVASYVLWNKHTSDHKPELIFCMMAGPESTL